MKLPILLLVGAQGITWEQSGIVVELPPGEEVAIHEATDSSQSSILVEKPTPKKSGGLKLCEDGIKLTDEQSEALEIYVAGGGYYCMGEFDQAERKDCKVVFSDEVVVLAKQAFESIRSQCGIPELRSFKETAKSQ